MRSSLDKISIKGADGQVKIHEPGLKTNRFNPLAMDVVPMNIQFYEGKIKINENEYIIKENEFYVDNYIRKINILENF